MVNVNPSVAYKVLPSLSLGVGADYVNLMNITAKSQINQSAVGGVDGNSDLSGHGSGWGYNVAALYKPLEKHSFGLSYRSQVRVPVTGSIELSNLDPAVQGLFNFAGPTYMADAQTSIILPASVLAGYAFKPTDKWTLLADYEWTQWNSFNNQDVAINETDPSRLSLLTGNPSSNVSSTARNWRNVSAVGFGANYKVDEYWQFRGGYAFYEKTSPNDTFSPDVPDAASHLLTAGVSRSWTNLTIDFAFNAQFYVNRSINNTVGNAVGASVNGTYKTFLPAIGLNFTYKFGH